LTAALFAALALSANLTASEKKDLTAFLRCL
jgi:hypothetical protein